MILHIIDRLMCIRSADLLVAAIPDDTQNDILERKLAEYPVQVFRGSELDVLDRYYQCARKYGMDHIVRATGDNPFVDPEEADFLIQAHIAGDFDYSCCFPEFGGKLPVGVGVEVFSFAALERSWREGTKSNHREHVNEYMQENASLFRVNFSSGSGKHQYPDIQMTIDTREDLERLRNL